MNTTATAKPYERMLFLPSLDNPGATINIVGISRDEAIALTDAYDKLVMFKRKTHINAHDVESLDFIGGSIDLASLADEDSEVLADLVRTLGQSEIPKQRGARAVYIDVDGDEIAVGTTVIYNENRAMVGVTDDSVLSVVMDAVLEATA